MIGTYIIMSYAMYHIKIVYVLCDTLHASMSGCAFFLCLARASKSCMSKCSVKVLILLK